MSRQAMLIDMNRCLGCGACVLACQEEWQLPLEVARNWVRPLPPVAGTSPPVFTHDVGLCQHCGKASCLKACPTGATFRDRRGRIRVDARACIGCGYCVRACPFDARTLHPERGVVEKCDFCAPLVDAGLQPACVRACPAGARVFGDLEDRRGDLARAFLKKPVRRRETRAVSTAPRVFYSGRKAALDRIAAAAPPDPSRLDPPLPGRVLRSAVRPAFLSALGVALLGATAAVLQQARRLPAPRPRPAERAGEPTLLRRGVPAILLHWGNALAWLLLVWTGLALLGRSHFRVLPPFLYLPTVSLFGSHATLLRVHIVVGVVWGGLLLLHGVVAFRTLLLPFLRSLRVRRDDWAWLPARVGNLFRRRPAPLPPQGRYNAGQKLFGLTVAVATPLLVVTGLVMAFLPDSGAWIQWSIPLHFAAAAAVLVFLVLHITMALLLQEERPALRSMTSGRIAEAFARDHHRRWWESHPERSRGRGSEGPPDTPTDRSAATACSPSPAPPRPDPPRPATAPPRHPTGR